MLILWEAFKLNNPSWLLEKLFKYGESVEPNPNLDILLKLGPLNILPVGEDNIASKLISKIYGVEISSITHKDVFSSIERSNSLYNLNKISYPVSTLFKTTFVIISWTLLSKFNRNGSK